jgi:hypothetical protein
VLRPDNPLPVHANSRGDWYCPATVITRLTALRTRDVYGLPDLDVRLQPLTAPHWSARGSAIDEEEGWSDAAGAEERVDWVADQVRSGTESEVLIVEEPELMLTPQAQRHLNRLLRSYGD